MTSKDLRLLITILVAFMFTMIVFNNITDYSTNFSLVEMLLKMEDIQTTKTFWRAIKTPFFQHAIYQLIILVEALVSLVCWVGAYMMLKGNPRGRKIATLGISLGFALFMFAFVTLAGEWFYLWDTPLKGMHTKFILITLLLGSFACFVSPEAVSEGGSI